MSTSDKSSAGPGVASRQSVPPGKAVISSPPTIDKPVPAVPAVDASPARNAKSTKPARSRPSPLEPYHRALNRLQMDSELGVPKRLAVVAARRGEGTSTVARMLSLVLAADLEASVCLVDLSSGAPMKRAGVQPGPRPAGIAEALLGGVPLQSCLHRTPNERVVLLGPGTAASKIGDGLARSPRLAPLFDELDSMFDYIVIDAPPVLAASSGVAAARHADAYLLVVQHGATSVDQVEAAVAELSPLPSAGVIMNQYASRIPRWARRFFGA